MKNSVTLVDGNSGYLPGVVLPNGVHGMSKRLDMLSNFMNFSNLEKEGMKEVWAMVGDNAKFQLLVPQKIIKQQVQIQSREILENYGSNIGNLQIFVLASGGFVFGKMLFDALSQMSPDALPRFFSLRTRTYEGMNIASAGVQVDTDSAYHVYFQLPGDGSRPENFCRGLLHNEQLDASAPVLILDDVLDSGRTIEAVKRGLSEIFHEKNIGTAFLVEKPQGLKTKSDPRSETAFNTSGIVVLGEPWLAGGGMDAGVGNDEEKRISRIGFGSGGLWAKV